MIVSRSGSVSGSKKQHPTATSPSTATTAAAPGRPTRWASAATPSASGASGIGCPRRCALALTQSTLQVLSNFAASNVQRHAPRHDRHPARPRRRSPIAHRGSAVLRHIGCCPGSRTWPSTSQSGTLAVTVGSPPHNYPRASAGGSGGRTHNSFPSGSESTTHGASAGCPTSTRMAPSPSSRATSAA
jgi:hypothetical protein